MQFYKDCLLRALLLRYFTELVRLQTNSESVVIYYFLKHVMILYAFQYTFQNKTLQYRKKKKNGKKSRSLHFERCIFLGLGVIFVMQFFS